MIIVFKFSKRSPCVAYLRTSRIYLPRELVYPRYGADERLVNLSRLNPSVPYQSFGCYKVIELQRAYVECMGTMYCIRDSRAEKADESIIYSPLSYEETRFLLSRISHRRMIYVLHGKYYI